jgi:hypothetical protein
LAGYYLIIPAARTVALVSFILIAYPVLFGMASALPVSALLTAGDMRFTHLVNLVFFLSLLLPLFPLFNHWPAVVLPLQGIAASTLLFN